MAIVDDIEVYVTAKHDRLLEHDNPNRDVTNDKASVEKYIEAESNVEFGVVVVLKAGFDYHQADGVQIECDFDGWYSRSTYYSRPMHKIRLGRLSADVTYEKNSMKVQRCGQWYQVKLCFGSVTVGGFILLNCIRHVLIFMGLWQTKIVNWMKTCLLNSWISLAPFVSKCSV